MKTRVPSRSSMKEMEGKTIRNKSISPINKRCNLTQSRRLKIDFFVHKSVGNEIRFGRVRSSKWLTFLVKFINTPGVDGSVLLNWLDRIPCLKKDKLYGKEFNRLFRSNHNFSFPPKWNAELEKAFEAEKIIPTSVQDESDNTVNETHEMETAADMNGTVNEIEEPVATSSKIKPIILRRVKDPCEITSEVAQRKDPCEIISEVVQRKDPCEVISEDSESTSSYSTVDIAPYIIFAPKKVESIDHGCDDILRTTISPGVEFLGNGVSTDETMNSESETTTEVRQDSKETVQDRKMNVEDDILCTPAEELLISPGRSEDDSFYVNNFDESLLPVESTSLMSKSQGTPAENGMCETKVETFEEPVNSVYNELANSTEQKGHPIMDQMKAEPSTSAAAYGQPGYPYPTPQQTTQRRLYFHKLRALCLPRDIDAFQSIVELENRISDVSTFLQNSSYYVSYCVESLQHIFSTMEATYAPVAPVHKPT